MIPKGSSVLVTGGCGFIGHHLVRALADRCDVTVIDDLSTGDLERIRPDLERGVRFVRVDIADAGALAEAFYGYDYIFHLAARPSVQASVEDPPLAHRANLTGTLNLLEAARHLPPRRFVFASTCAVYGDAPPPLGEASATIPLSPYATAKLAAEHYVANYAALHGLPAVTLRLFNVYGPGQDPSSPYAAVIPRFVDRVLDGKPPVIFGDGLQTRDFVFVDDVVSANLAAAESPLTRGEAVNIASGRPTRIADLARTVADLGPAGGSDVEHGPARPGEVRDSWAAPSPLWEPLGWSPRTSLGDGLRRTFDWFRERRAA